MWFVALGCKPTYEGLKCHQDCSWVSFVFRCKPTYEGLKSNVATPGGGPNGGCKPTYEGLKSIGSHANPGLNPVLQAYL